MTSRTQTQPAPGARGPVKAAERALAPDLARGAMLLLIALANASGIFLAATPGLEAEPEGLERLYNFLSVEFVHARAFPLFAIMFGYGLVQLARRQEAAGATRGQIRSILLRRNGWLLAFGAAHALLLYSGDFLGGYGLIGIAFTLLLLFRGDGVHRIAPWYLAVAFAYTAVLAALALGSLGSGSGADLPVTPFSSAAAESYGAALVERAAEWPVHTLTLLPMILMVWLGAWAARHRFLEEPGRHLRLLAWTAAGGLAVAATAGLPMALLSAGLLDTGEEAAGAVRMLYETSGFFGGVGYVALFGLLAHALTRQGRPSGPIVTAITALGQRSLSGYLFQSVAWTVLAMPYTLALGERFGSPLLTSGACALVVWLATVLAADAMRRASYRGPAETLLRRLTYGRR
jgi:uncharacterized protein